MKKLLFCLIFLSLYSEVVQSQEFSGIDYRLITEAKSKWMEGYLIRFFKTTRDECLGFVDSLEREKDENDEITYPVELQLYKNVPLCHINGKSIFDITYGAYIQEVYFESNVIHLLLIDKAEANLDQERKCFIIIKKGEFSELKCEEPKLLKYQ